jgi:quercetin dioxygenase-like cupin family protein
LSIFEGSRAFKLETPDARTYQMRGTLWRVLATGADTGGVVGAIDEKVAHGLAAPMHAHEDCDEIFYVLDGELTFFVGDERIEAAEGAFVYLPRFVHHGFQCNSKDARVFNFVTPAGFEQLVIDKGTPAKHDDEPLPAGPHQHRPPHVLEELRKKYGMRALIDNHA